MSMTEEDAYRLASRIYRAKDNTAEGNERILEEYFSRNYWMSMKAFGIYPRIQP